MRTRAVRDGDDWVLNGTKRWITNAGVSEYYTVMAVTDPTPGRRGISAFVVEKDDAGFCFGARSASSASRVADREIYFDNCRIPADRMIGDEGTGLRTALRTLDHTRVTIAAQAVGIAQGALDFADRLRQGAQAVRQGDRRVPGRAVHARRHGDEDRGGAQADLRGRREVRARRRPT